MVKSCGWFGQVGSLSQIVRDDAGLEQEVGGHAQGAGAAGSLGRGGSAAGDDLVVGPKMRSRTAFL
jgi:hypothetical protein